MAVRPATPEYLKWSEVPITFNHSDHLDFMPKSGQYHLIVSLIIKDVKLNRVLVNEVCSLNILFLNTFDQIGLPRSTLHPSQALFHSIVPGAAVTPITFGTQEKFHTGNLQFKVADFEMAYNAFLRHPALTEFMVIPHYDYLHLKMLGLHSVISIRGDIKCAYDCDRESCETADRLTASAEL
jgi:hypothetical protein